MTPTIKHCNICALPNVLHLWKPNSLHLWSSNSGQYSSPGSNPSLAHVWMLLLYKKVVKLKTMATTKFLIPKLLFPSRELCIFLYFLKHIKNFWHSLLGLEILMVCPSAPTDKVLRCWQHMPSNRPNPQNPTFVPAFAPLPNSITNINCKDASIQKTQQSGFAWVIVNEVQALCKGIGLAPGCARDMYLCRADGPYEFSNTTINCFCDNLWIITTITNMRMTASIVQPNETTNDD